MSGQISLISLPGGVRCVHCHVALVSRDELLNGGCLLARNHEVSRADYFDLLRLSLGQPAENADQRNAVSLIERESEGVEKWSKTKAR